MLQAKIRNVKPEPESVGQRPRLEDAWGIDRFESRYAGTRSFSLQFYAPVTRSTCIDGWPAISWRLRWALFHFDAVIAMMHSQALTLLYIQTTMD